MLKAWYLIILAALILSLLGICAGKTLYVGGPGNYSTIKEAISNAASGDTILVHRGTYPEKVEIINSNAYLKLLGDGTKPEIKTNSGITIRLYGSPGYMIDGFTITASGNSCDAISITNSHSSIIRNNTIIANGSGNIEGIAVYDDSSSKGSVIHNNTIIVSSSDSNSYGILVQHCKDNFIRNNIITASNGIHSYGIYILGGSSSNTITGNTISITNITSDSGIYTQDGGNRIYLNCITGPGYSSSGTGNTWINITNYTYNGATKQMQVGNYWSVYKGSDNNIDGIGDTPYFLLGTESDLNPMMRTAVGKVYMDTNGNGAKDNGEGLAGWKVYIDSNRNGLFDRGEINTTTLSDGNYSLPNLAPGTYTVRVQPNVTWPAPTTPSTGLYLVKIGCSGSVFNQDFVYNPGTITCIAWEDQNANGIRETGELGLQGVTVSLLDSSGNPISVNGQPVTAQTNTLGKYQFKAVPGSYKVKFAKSGYSFSPKNAGNPNNDSKDSDVDASSGISDLINATFDTTHIIDAGLHGTLNISGMAFHDLNGNGVRDMGELGLSGWTINLKDSSGKSRTSTTSSDSGIEGRYKFDLLPPDTYTIEEIIPNGWIQTKPAAPGKYTITLTTTGASNYDFGDRKKVLPQAGCVDKNANGTHTAHFGYIGGAGTASIPVADGSNNYFMPSPASRGQPAEFSSGSHPNAFSVNFNDSSITWNLDGATVTASSSSAIVVAVAGVTVCSGGPTTMTALVSGCASPSYQWYNGSGIDEAKKIPGATQQTYAPTVSGTYTCKATCGSGCTGYSSGVLTINPKPVILIGPQSQNVSSGTTVTFSVVVQPKDLRQYSYQWQKKSRFGYTNIAGATGSKYTIIATSCLGLDPCPNCQYADITSTSEASGMIGSKICTEGIYRVVVSYKNTGCSTISAEATLQTIKSTPWPPKPPVETE